MKRKETERGKGREEVEDDEELVKDKAERGGGGGTS